MYRLLVEELRETLSSLSSIPTADQILLSGPPFGHLDARRMISSYGLPDKNKRIFLFDRRMLSQEQAAPPDDVALIPLEIECTFFYIL